MISVLKVGLTVFITTLMSFSVFASQTTTPEEIAGTTKVTAEDIFDLVDDHDDLVIIDARKPSDRESGYIAESIGLPNTDTTPKMLSKYIPTKSTPVVFYCNGENCGRSVESSEIAVKEGYTQVYWFRGGWDEWTKKGLPVIKD
ncbi:rhodanese-like domain-containing protein [Vibrio sp.]|nr:rhodanese-like domain-containing protein [Vibrio sp.]